MGDVAVQLKVMPQDPELDLDDLSERLGEALPEGASIDATDTEDVAFGLTALLLAVVVPDEAGGTDAVEDAFSDVDGVESISVENVGRV